VTGNLTLTGVTKSITFPATIHFAPESVQADAEFSHQPQRLRVVYPGAPDESDPGRVRSSSPSGQRSMSLRGARAAGARFGGRVVLARLDASARPRGTLLGDVVPVRRLRGGLPYYDEGFLALGRAPARNSTSPPGSWDWDYVLAKSGDVSSLPAIASS